jgi:hypothetical protein
MKTHSLKAVVTALLSVIILIASNSVFAKGGDDNNRLRLRCGADGTTSDISMDAKFETRGTRMTFDASFEAGRRAGLSVGDMLPVMVGTCDVGDIELVTVRRDLVGDIEFDNNIEAGDDSMDFPDCFPDVVAGTVVQVGGLECALAP